MGTHFHQGVSEPKILYLVRHFNTCLRSIHGYGRSHNESGYTGIMTLAHPQPLYTVAQELRGYAAALEQQVQLQNLLEAWQTSGSILGFESPRIHDHHRLSAVAYVSYEVYRDRAASLALWEQADALRTPEVSVELFVRFPEMAGEA